MTAFEETLGRVVVRSIVLSIIFSLVVGTASAQDAPSDNDLFAGYCYSVTLFRGLLFKGVAMKPCDGPDAACREAQAYAAEHQKAEEDRFHRINEYLTAKRFFHERSKSAAFEGVGRAVALGSDDIKGCAGLDPAVRKDPEACNRVIKCNDISRLPF